MESAEQLLREVLRALGRLEERASPESLPMVLTPKRAAEELSIGLTTLQEMIARRELLTVKVRGRHMIPTREIIRISTPKETHAKTPAPKGHSKKVDVRTEAEKVLSALRKPKR